MTTQTEAVRLTAKMRFCLLCFEKAETQTTFEVAKRAIWDGVNRTTCKYEWADAPMRQLRKAGLLEYGDGRRMDRRVHKLTEAGRKALRAAQRDRMHAE